MGIVFVVALFGALFCTGNKEFLETAKKEKAEGYEWHYVGVTGLDPKAKSIPLQVKPNDPYILWKLKKPE